MNDVILKNSINQPLVCLAVLLEYMTTLLEYMTTLLEYMTTLLEYPGR